MDTKGNLVALAGILVACSPAMNKNEAAAGDFAANTTPPKIAMPTPVATETTAPEGRRYVGKWAAEGLCPAGIWEFEANHLSTAGEVSCDLGEPAAVGGGISVPARCLAEGTRSEEALSLTFGISADGRETMTVRSRTLGPATLMRCAA